MSDLVYFNEPGYEGEIGTSEGEACNEAYSNIVRYKNIQFAMIEAIKNPYFGFEKVILKHFYMKRKVILKEVRGWMERAKTSKASYSSYLVDHNSILSDKF